MNGLIGSAQSAKFIIISCDDQKNIPQKKEMSNYFPNHQMHIYKSGGHFIDSFHDIRDCLGMMKLGVKHDYPINANKISKRITHAIRVSLDCNRSSFFDLKYGDMIIDNLQLTYESLSRLSSLLENIKEVNNAIREVIKCKYCFTGAKDIATKLQLYDPKIFTPNQQSIEGLFDHYGDVAIHQLIERLEEWHTSVLWN